MYTSVSARALAPLLALPRAALAVLGLLLALLTFGCAKERVNPAKPAATSLPLPGPAPAQRLALLVGINDYKYDEISDLHGTGNDLAAMQDVLTRNYGFREQDIVVLKDSAATKSNIQATFRKHLVDRSNADTVSLFYYSGHGSQMYDSSGDEPDQYDETIVTYDTGRTDEHPNLDLSDDEMNLMLTELGQKTPHITVILDSCHSGTAARRIPSLHAGGVPRAVPADDRARPKDAPVAPALKAPQSQADDWRAAGLSYTLISGARTDEFSYESALAGKPMGALTWFLTRALTSATASDTYRDIMSQVGAQVSEAFPQQHPQLEGIDQDSVLFGLQRIKAEPFLEIQKEAGVSQLQGGLIHGVSVGSRFLVYPAKTKDFSGKPLAVVEVTSSEATRSRLKVVEGEQNVPDGARALEDAHQFGGRPLRVFVRAADKAPLLGAVAQKLATYSHIKLVDTAAEYDISIVEDEQKQIVLEGGSGEPIADPTKPGALATQRVVEQVLAWAKWHGLESLANETVYGLKPLKVGLTLSSAKPVKAGDPIDVEIRNDSAQKVYVSLLDLSADGGVSIVYPAPGAAEFIEAGSTWRKPIVPCSPKGAKAPVRDVLKAIFTTAPHDLSFLEQPALLTAAQAKSLDNPIAALVAGIAQGADVRGVTRPTVAVSTWATRQVSLIVEPGHADCK